ncbi:hypothetical protein OHT57_35010 [Streptomyces sp. NBC_00285]|uniref:hypothetical protein n=1 Tax=Streptomyces sp. NBC_00285 TaxID=2975700 RepID=UPI002E2CA404|nr:hypothetical protein [Streptomyces sp. NBC_00285]
MRRCVIAMAGVAVGAGLLSGCGAIDLPLAAVQLGADGKPHALIRPCGDDRVQGLSLTGTKAKDGSGPNLSGWHVPDTVRPGNAGFPLFSPLTDWHARPSGTQTPVADYTYQLGFMKGESNYEYSVTLTFRTADLAKLKPGQVWADDRAMSLGEFEKLAEDSC